MVEMHHFQNCSHDAPQIGISSIHKVMHFHTHYVMQLGATGMFCSSDSVSSLITFLLSFGTSLKTIHNQLCGAHTAYKQLQHSWWSPESQLTACLIAACRTTDAPSCRCSHPDEIRYAVQIVELVFLLAAGTVHLQHPLFKMQVWQQIAEMIWGPHSDVEDSMWCCLLGKQLSIQHADCLSSMWWAFTDQAPTLGCCLDLGPVRCERGNKRTGLKDYISQYKVRHGHDIPHFLKNLM